MSKNYNKFYKPQNEEVKNEEKIEEVQDAAEAVEEVQEEAPAEEPKVEEVKQPEVKTATVLGPKPVNMRFKPSKAGQVINVIPAGTQVVVKERESEWTHCSFKGITGYMMTQFLKFN